MHNYIYAKSGGKPTTEEKLTTTFKMNGKLESIREVLKFLQGFSDGDNLKVWVNGRIATETATFRGTYNLVNDLSLSVSATRAQIAAALGTTISTADNNDFCYVEIPIADAIPNRIQRTDRYKFNGTEWAYEFTVGDADLAPYRAFHSSWHTDTTLLQFCQDVVADSEVIIGDLFLGSLTCSGLPEGMQNGEVSVQVQNGLNNQKLLVLSLSSTNLPPYYWMMCYFNGTLYGWRSWITPQYVTDIEAISDSICKLLKEGDIIIKVSGNSKHTYIVSYRNDTDGEMSLTYTDHENIEEVYYEIRSGVWNFVQKDIKKPYQKPSGGIPVTDLTGSLQAMIQYDDVYIGIASSSADILDSTHHHDNIFRGKPIPFSNASGYIFVVIPEDYNPVVAVNLIETQISLDSTTTIGGKNYKIWKSGNSYQGSFNVYLF